MSEKTITVNLQQQADGLFQMAFAHQLNIIHLGDDKLTRQIAGIFDRNPLCQCIAAAGQVAAFEYIVHAGEELCLNANDFGIGL